MNETARMLVALVAGLGLGMLFFYGLWLTVQRTLTARNPALWMLGSFLLRVSIVVAGFYYVAQGNWRHLFSCLLGFVAARFLVIYLTRLDGQKQLAHKKPISHEF
ncbi:MAG: hypothetical protein JWP57_1325 [Spirosoma sp.]|nr:hypothetical protein [Spirosoma sp.]